MTDTVCEEYSRIKIPNYCKDNQSISTDIIIGIDEAGRGPVIGSLIYSAAFWPCSFQDQAIKLGFNDSKQLNEETRDKLLMKILNTPEIGYVVDEVSAETISFEMQRQTPVSLNQISFLSVVSILNTINKYIDNINIVTVFVDTVGDPSTYKRRLEQAMPNSFCNEFIVESKADSKYAVVSAASIVAKVTRDKLTKSVQLPNQSFGSGYPSDEICVQWLQKNINKVFGFSSIVRFSWSTCKDLLDKEKAVKVAWECDNEDDMNGCTAITSFFPVKGSEKRPSRCQYFNNKKLKIIQPNDLIDM